MANRELIYDFRAALEKIIASHSDLTEVITKWEEMLSPTPRMVEFKLSDGVHSVPNVQMIIDSIERSGLPTDPEFHTVSAVERGGSGVLSPSGVKFSGSAGTFGDNRFAEYDVNGMSGYVYDLKSNVTITNWPLPRYIHPSQSGATLRISPDIAPSTTASMGDFFVRIESGRTLTVEFVSYNGVQTKILNSPSGSSVVWHLAVYVLNSPNSGGNICIGYASLMDM